VRIFAALATFLAAALHLARHFREDFQTIGAQDHDLLQAYGEFAFQVAAPLVRKDIRSASTGPE